MPFLKSNYENTVMILLDELCYTAFTVQILGVASAMFTSHRHGDVPLGQ